ncbi:MAG: M24 family metallopeptidase [Candidatus Nanoarchaeia archaeon]
MKQKELRKHLRDKKIDVAVFSNLHLQEADPNFVYLSGYEGIGFLVVPKIKPAFLLVPPMEALRAKRNSFVRVVVAKENLAEELKKKIGRVKIVGYDKKGMTVAFLERLKRELKGSYRDIGRFCRNSRAVKTKEEIKILRKACSLTDKIFQKTFRHFKDFRTEADVAAFMLNETYRSGLEPSFKPIVASGKNAAEPHHGSRPEKLRKGFCIIDFGLKYKGYCSDESRTVYLGKPDKKEIEMYSLLLGAQETAMAIVKPGIKFSDVDDMAKKILGKMSRYFIHAVGHGVGVEVHEDPFVSKGGTIIRAGMVLTVEPGVYIPGRSGIRIEDQILVTEEGSASLTRTGRQLLILKHKF